MKKLLNYIVIKRCLGFIFSLSLILILMPLLIVVAISIKLDSPGPIFYSCLRIGKYGKPFKYFKFRSMYVGTNKVTNFGRFIRRWHLDELPELFLVLIGRLSLVGPRPMPYSSITREHQAYSDSLQVKPGMTGPFQVRHNRRKNIEHIIFLNNWYAKKQCFFVDFSLILKTPKAIWKQKDGTDKSVKID